MNFDIEIEQASQTEPYHFLLSPPKPQVDSVDWASSQPSALHALLLEVSKKPEKRRIQHETTWPGYDDSTAEPVNAASFEHTTTRSRPLRRTNSSLRARLGSDSASSISSKPPPAPDDSFWHKDRPTVLAACQNVSERMDENAFLQLAKSRDATGPSKRMVKAPHLAAALKTRRASMPHSVAQRQEINRWEKGKQRESFVPEARAHGTERMSLLSSSSSSSSTSASSPVTSSSSPYAINTSITMDVDSANTSVDVEPDDKTNAAPTYVGTKSSSLSAHTSSISAPNAAPPTNHSNPTLQAPKPKLHPLLTEKHNHRQDPIRAPPIPHHHPAPLPSVPAPSQSTRPPALGMRRVHSVPTPAHQNTLPMRQKGFKPPLLFSQPLPRPAPNQRPVDTSRPVLRSSQVSPAHAYPSSRPAVGSNPPRVEKEVPKANLPVAQSRPSASRRPLQPEVELHDEEYSRLSRPPSPEVNPDADSSFGEMSFDMDALEATMQMYD